MEETGRPKWVKESIEKQRVSRQRRSVYAEHHVETLLTCPICGVSEVFSVPLAQLGARGSQIYLYMEGDKTLEAMRSHIAAEPGPGNNVYRFQCALGHQWKMDGRHEAGVLIFDRWDAEAE